MSYTIIPTKGKKIQLRAKKRIPYMEIVKLLLQGEDVFMEVDRKMAYYINNRLNAMLKELGVDARIEKYPSTMDDDASNAMEGYTFKMVRFGKGGESLVLKEVLIEELNKRLDKAVKELTFLERQPPDRTLNKPKAALKARIESLKEIIKLIEEL
ncbi:MAG: hypothetical protein ACXQS2_05400 [Methermicoccaceae archaeon]